MEGSFDGKDRLKVVQRGKGMVLEIRHGFVRDAEDQKGREPDLVLSQIAEVRSGIVRERTRLDKTHVRPKC